MHDNIRDRFANVVRRAGNAYCYFLMFLSPQLSCTLTWCGCTQGELWKVSHGLVQSINGAK